VQAVRHGDGTVVLVMDVRSAGYLVKILDDAMENERYRDVKEIGELTAEKLAGVLEPWDHVSEERKRQGS